MLRIRRKILGAVDNTAHIGKQVVTAHAAVAFTHPLKRLSHQIRLRPIEFSCTARKPSSQFFRELYGNCFHLAMVIRFCARYRPRLLNRLRINRRSHRPCNRQRRPAEKEFVHFVRRAIVGQIFQIEYLAHGDADHRNHHPVPRL